MKSSASSTIRSILILVLMVPTIALAQANFWQPTNGPNDRAVTSLVINSKGHLFAMGNSLYRSTDNGSTWTKLNTFIWTSNGGYSFYPSVLSVIPQDYILGGSYGAIYMSTDNGDTWQKRSDVYNGYSGQLYSVTSFTVTPDSSVYAGTQGQGVYYSDNLGYSWYGGTDVGDNFVHSLATSAKGFVFVGTDSRVYRENYNGHGWGWGSQPNFGDVISLATTRKGYAFASTISYWYDVYGNLTSSTASILRSTEDSVFFWPVNNGLPNSTFTGKYILTSNSAGDVFAGNDSSGVYRSTDNGLNWRAINGGLTDVHVQSMAVSVGGYIFVGTRGGLVYRSSQPTTGIVASGNSTPKDFTLSQNFPNPFNPSTTIQFSLPNAAYTSLKVFNILGEQVASLVSGNLEAGQHFIRWNAAGVTSGVYFYRLQAGDFTETKKLILVR
jgi:photosystem II stability/assembly factor-like uncharacterized protein